MYCRKSSEDEDRQVASNESQVRELIPLATRDNLRLHRTIQESASAKSAGTRTLFNGMVEQIRIGEANGIICWHPNRLSRNAVDAAVLVDLMDKGKLLEIRMPGQIFKNSPQDKFLFSLLCSQAKLENDNKSRDVTRGLESKLKMGWRPGVAPMGYLNDKTKNRGERDLYNDEERFPLVKKMWQLMLTGTRTPPQILRIANEQWGFRTRRTKRQGGAPLSLSSIYNVFHNPFYYGSFEYPIGSGKWFQGNHEPMVSKEEFDRVQVLLGRRGNPRPSKHMTFSFTGLIRCGACAGTITAEEKHQVICSVCQFKFAYRSRQTCPHCETAIAKMTNPMILQYTYYHCAKRKAGCKQPSIRAAQLERQIADQLGRIQISDKFKSWSFKYIHELYAEEIRTAEHIAQNRDKAYADCSKRLQSLIALKTSPENADGSLLSDQEYGEQRRRLLQDQARFAQSREDITREAEAALKKAQATFEFAHSARRCFDEGDFQVKKQILASIGSNLILFNKKLSIEAKLPFKLIQEYTSHQPRANGRIEPKNIQANSAQNGPNSDVVVSQLRGLKDVRTFSPKIKKLVAQIYYHFSRMNMLGAHWKN